VLDLLLQDLLQLVADVGVVSLLDRVGGVPGRLVQARIVGRTLALLLLLVEFEVGAVAVLVDGRLRANGEAGWVLEDESRLRLVFLLKDGFA
jgi:hypothetical protein